MQTLATGILNSPINIRQQRGRSRASCDAQGCASVAGGRMPGATAHGGFTLLELLLVILIIGIILSFAALSIGRGNERNIEEEMRRLAGLIELAAQEATLQSRDTLVQFNGNKYEFMAFKDNKWQLITHDDTFRPRRLPEEMRLIVQIENEPITLGTETSEKTDNTALPRIYLLSSGEMTPFQLTLKDASNNKEDNTRYQLTGNINGKIEIRPPNSVPKK